MPSKRKRAFDFASTLISEHQVFVDAYGTGRCIVATRVAVELARENGIAASPLPVSVDVGSEGKPLWGRLGFEPPDQVPPGNWNGHLVCILEQTRLLDLTLDTVRGPGGQLQPTTIEVPFAFRKGGAVETSLNGIAVRYEAHPEELDYLRREDWTDVPERDRALTVLRSRIAIV